MDRNRLPQESRPHKGGVRLGFSVALLAVSLAAFILYLLFGSAFFSVSGTEASVPEGAETVGEALAGAFGAGLGIAFAAILLAAIMILAGIAVLVLSLIGIPIDVSMWKLTGGRRIYGIVSFACRAAMIAAVVIYFAVAVIGGRAA